MVAKVEPNDFERFYYAPLTRLVGLLCTLLFVLLVAGAYWSLLVLFVFLVNPATFFEFLVPSDPPTLATRRPSSSKSAERVRSAEHRASVFVSLARKSLEWASGAYGRLSTGDEEKHKKE